MRRRRTVQPRGLSDAEAKQVVAGIRRHIAATSPRPLPGPSRIENALRQAEERSDRLRQYLRGTAAPTKENR